MYVASSAEARLDALREQVRQIENARRPSGRGVLSFGIEAVDDRLAGGGIALAALHEAAPERPSLNDDSAALLFLAAMAGRLSRVQGKGQVLWALARRDLFAPGLAAVGLGPDRLIYAECRDDAEILAVMEEGLRHGGLAAVVGAVSRAAMAAARRLQLAAEEGGTTALLLRRWRKSGEDPLAAPSSAVTRWRIGCAPSAPLPVEGIGRARWHVDLARQRGGEPFNFIMDACDAEGRLALPALPAHRPAAADRRAEAKAA